MTWWQVLLVFAGIPAVMFVAITVVVLRLTTPTTPDGIAALQRRREAEEARARQAQAEDPQAENGSEEARPPDRSDDTEEDTR